MWHMSEKNVPSLSVSLFEEKKTVVYPPSAPLAFLFLSHQLPVRIFQLVSVSE